MTRTAIAGRGLALLLCLAVPLCSRGSGEPREAGPTAAPATAPSTRPAAGPFVVVLIDAKTEAALGPFPYDRSVYARAIERAAAAGARGVVLKFFIDRPKAGGGDRALAEAMGKTKVILQAGRDDDPAARPNDLPERFLLGPAPPDDTKTLAADRAMIPLPSLAARAHDVGFIDHAGLDRMPLVERHRGRYVKSLYTCALELATGQTARWEPGKSLRLGDKTIRLDESNQTPVRYPPADDLVYIPLSDLLDGPPRPELKDRVVVIGWDGKAFAPIDTPMGKVRPHRVFCYALMSLYEQVR